MPSVGKVTPEHPVPVSPHSLVGVFICRREVGQLIPGSLMLKYPSLIHPPLMLQ